MVSVTSSPMNTFHATVGKIELGVFEHRLSRKAKRVIAPDEMRLGRR